MVLKKKLCLAAKIFLSQPFSYLESRCYKSGSLLKEAGLRNQSPSNVQVIWDTLTSHVCQKKLVFASINSFPFLLLSVPSIVTQNVLPSPVGSHCPLASRKMYDRDALIAVWWQIFKGITWTLKKVHRKYVIVFYLSKAKRNKKELSYVKQKSFLTWDYKTMSSFLFKVQLSTDKAWRYMHSAVLVFCLCI